MQKKLCLVPFWVFQCDTEREAEGSIYDNRRILNQDAYPLQTGTGFNELQLTKPFRDSFLQDQQTIKYTLL